VPHNRRAPQSVGPTHRRFHFGHYISWRYFNKSESLDSIKSWIENEKRVDGLKILAVLELAKAGQFPSLVVSHKAAEVANVEDTGRKYEHFIHRTIDQFEKRDFYQQHLDTVELRHQRQQNEGLKRFEIAIRMPVGYYWGSKHASSLS
jgi:hypothetical protein